MEEGEFSQAPMRTWLPLRSIMRRLGRIVVRERMRVKSINLSAAISYSVILALSCFCSGSCPLWPYLVNTSDVSIKKEKKKKASLREAKYL